MYTDWNCFLGPWTSCFNSHKPAVMVSEVAFLLELSWIIVQFSACLIIDYLLFIFNRWYFWSFRIRFNFFFNEVVLNHKNYENLCIMVKRCKNKRDYDAWHSYLTLLSLSTSSPEPLFRPISTNIANMAQSIEFIFFRTSEGSCPSGDHSDKEKFILITFSKSFV